MNYIRTNNRPIKIIQHYKDYRTMNEDRLDKAIHRVEDLRKAIIELRKRIIDNKSNYRKQFKIDLDCYEEWIKDTYITGKLFRDVKSAFTKASNLNNQTDILDLVKYARYKQELSELDKNITFYNKILKIKVWDYSRILLEYAKQIHKKIILEGAGYSFGHGLGVLAVLRYKNKSKFTKFVDYNATNKARQKVLDEGGKLYDKETAKWCKENNIPYDLKPIIVYKNRKEYIDQFVLILKRCKDATLIDYHTSELRNHKDAKGLTNKQIAEKCDNDVEKICDFAVDIQTKLHICGELKPELYNNYIRYENQEDIADRAASRKDRQ